jgi:hypothetical protein
VDTLLKAFDTLSNATVPQMLALAALIIPGLLSLRVYEAKRGGEGRKANDVLIDIAAYSFVTDIVGFSLLSVTNLLPHSPQHVALRALIFVLAFVGFPILLGWGWYETQAWMVRVGFVADPVQKPWDKVFRRIAREKLNLVAIVTLRDGRRVASRLLDPAYASTYPADEQILLGEMWNLDEEGRLVAPYSGSYGMLIDKADIETLEFLEWSSVEKYLIDKQKEERDGQRQA